MGKCLHRRSILEGEEEDVIEEMEEERDASVDTDKDENHGIESRHFFNSLKKCKKHCHGHCPEVKKGQWKCVNSRNTSVQEAISYLQQAIISSREQEIENTSTQINGDDTTEEHTNMNKQEQRLSCIE